MHASFGEHPLTLLSTEHFSTPLHFARTHYKLSSTLIPFPSGTGHMITALQSNEIDIAIGLTEGWVAGLGKAAAEQKDAGYKMVGTYVETPLCWAISTGAKREDVTDVGMLKGRKMGVSRIGRYAFEECPDHVYSGPADLRFSGSYVMGFVLADTRNWLSPSERTTPFNIIPLQTFSALRIAVNDSSADFFMWEHFTTKRYYTNGSLKRIGEIYTPWPSWHIVAAPQVLQEQIQLEEFMEKLNLGIEYFNNNKEEAVKYISTELDYEKEDAEEWLGTVRFAGDVRGVREKVIVETAEVLKKAGVIGEVEVKDMIGIRAKEQAAP